MRPNKYARKWHHWNRETVIIINTIIIFLLKKKTPDKLRLKCQVFCLLNKYHNLSKGFLLLIVKRTKKIKYNLNCVARLNDKN